MGKMKKLVWGAALLWCTTSLVSCAIPEKTTVGRPMPPKPAPPVMTTTSSGQTPSANGATTVPQPLYLEPDADQPQHFQEQDIENSLPTMSYINDRLFEYGRKLDRWKALDRKSADAKLTPEDSEQMVVCFRQLQGVLNGYGDLRGKLLQTTDVEEAQKAANSQIWSLQKDDIEFIEGPCGALLKDKKDEGAGWTQREDGADLGQQETLIDRYASTHEYEEVVKIWQQIPENQSSRAHLRTKVQYANALAHLQQVDKAAQIYKQVVEQMAVSDEQATDLVSLRKVLADLYTAAGDYPSALAQYNKIADDFQNLSKIQEWAKQQVSILDRAKEDSPELKEYSNILKNYLSFQPQRDGYKIVWQADQFLKDYPYSSVASNVDTIRASVQQAADKWFGGVMSEVDRLNKQKRYDDGLKLLETVQIGRASCRERVS
jgi:tetratricopeptide (TPR) repeat protein